MEKETKKQPGCLKNIFYLAITAFCIIYVVKMCPKPARPEAIEQKQERRKPMPEVLRKAEEQGKQESEEQKAVNEESSSEADTLSKEEEKAKKEAEEKRKIEARKKTLETKKKCCDLLFELLQFKGKSDFAVYGFGTGGPYNAWLRKAEELRNSTNFRRDDIPFEVAAAPGVILQLGMEYVTTKGKESEYTRTQLPELKKTIDFEKYLKQQKKSAKTKKDPRRK